MKILKLVLCFYLCINASYAAFPKLYFENISGQYKDGQGLAFADAAKYDLKQVKITHKEIQVDFDKPGKHLVIRDGNTAVELNFDFSFLNIFKSFNFENVNISSESKRFGTFFDSIDLFIEPKTYTINGLELIADVTKITDVDTTNISVLQGFILEGQLNIAEILFNDSTKEEILQDMISENPLFADRITKDMKRIKLPLKVRNVKLEVKREIFSGRALLDSWLNVNLYLNGKITENMKEKNMTIELTNAKLGYISIRKLLLKSVRNLNLNGVTVVGNKILINFAKVSFPVSQVTN